LEKHAKGRRFSNDEVKWIYFQGMQNRFIQQELFTNDGKPLDGGYILDQKGFYNFAAQMFGIKSRCVEYRREPVSYKTKPGEEEILELKRSGVKGSHFVCGNGSFGVPLKARIEFDPIEGGSKSARDGWIESVRVFVIKDGIK
jgi:hypothetical protein